MKKTIILTGAAGSIGSEIIKSFHKSYRLICVDTDIQNLKNLKKIYKSINIFKCNLLIEKEVNSLIKKVLRDFNKIDILINNAGKIYSSPIIKLGKEKFLSHNFKMWKKVIDINLNSLFLISSKVIEALCNQRKSGLIINVSSISANGNIGQSAYSSAKKSIEVLTKIWADELKDFDIRVACVAPGFFDTKSTKKSLNKIQIEHIQKFTPLKRLGRPNELVHCIKFIINNKFFNGKTLRIDGGLNL